MKAPCDTDADLSGPSFDPWTHSSEVREDAARANTMALRGYRTAAPGQDALPVLTLPFAFTAQEVHVPHFVFVWAADIDSRGTSGWLGVPALGEQSFAAVHPLWSDPDGYVPGGARRVEPTGPNYDERATKAPTLTLKPRPAQEGHA